jgi:hypothetical protein
VNRYRAPVPAQAHDVSSKRSCGVVILLHARAPSARLVVLVDAVRQDVRDRQRGAGQAPVLWEELIDAIGVPDDPGPVVDLAAPRRRQQCGQADVADVVARPWRRPRGGGGISTKQVSWSQTLSAPAATQQYEADEASKSTTVTVVSARCGGAHGPRTRQRAPTSRRGMGCMARCLGPRRSPPVEH